MTTHRHPNRRMSPEEYRAHVDAISSAMLAMLQETGEAITSQDLSQRLPQVNGQKTSIGMTVRAIDRLCAYGLMAPAGGIDTPGGAAALWALTEEGMAA